MARSAGPRLAMARWCCCAARAELLPAARPVPVGTAERRRSCPGNLKVPSSQALYRLGSSRRRRRHKPAYWYGKFDELSINSYLAEGFVTTVGWLCEKTAARRRQRAAHRAGTGQDSPGGSAMARGRGARSLPSISAFGWAQARAKMSSSSNSQALHAEAAAHLGSVAAAADLGSAAQLQHPGDLVPPQRQSDGRFEIQHRPTATDVPGAPESSRKPGNQLRRSTGDLPATPVSPLESPAPPERIFVGDSGSQRLAAANGLQAPLANRPTLRSNVQQGRASRAPCAPREPRNSTTIRRPRSVSSTAS